jgi:hypothetical protein
MRNNTVLRVSPDAGVGRSTRLRLCKLMCPRRPPLAAMQCRPTTSSDSRTTGPVAGPSSSGMPREDRPLPRASTPLHDDLDSSSASESEASVTRWRPPGPSAGTSAGDSTHSSGWVQSQADADSATSQRYVLPRFVISTRTRPSHPQLQPLPLRPHTAQFHPSQAAAGPSFVQPAGSGDAAGVQQAWVARPVLRPMMAPQAGADRRPEQGEVRAAGGRRVRGRQEGAERPRAGDRRRGAPLEHPPRVAPALRVRPAGLEIHEEDQAEVEDDFDPEGAPLSSGVLSRTALCLRAHWGCALVCDFSLTWQSSYSALLNALPGLLG